MTTLPAAERIAQLQAQAQAQRLSAQLAILELREQLAPLRSAAGAIGAAVHALSPSGTAGGAIGKLTKFGIGHPLLVSSLGTFALRLLRRRPLAFLIAAATGAAAWWLFRPTETPTDRQEPPA